MKKPFKQASEVQASTPAIVLYNPRYPHNVGSAVRACSCFGVEQVWLTGNRVAEKVWNSQRLPREERMKGFSDVSLVLGDRPFTAFPEGATPVAVELLPGSENLLSFEHPEEAIYVFGPEDGSIPSPVRGLCHRRVFIPTRHCTNLGAAVYLVLYDRLVKRYLNGTADASPIDRTLAEVRGWPVDDDPRFVTDGP